MIRVLGEGSHGVVLLVEHTRLGKPFVVKLIQQRFSANKDVVARFIAEAQRVARLDHEAFVPIVDLGETDDGRAYFVMEYLAGDTLQQSLRDRGSFSIEKGLDLGLQLLDGLAAAHEAQIIHRDIKPANLFITARGKLKILDFGISKSMVDSGTGSQTAHGVAIGTPKYMSPEQAFGKPVAFSTDIYAVGLVLFEILTGSIVFDGTDTKAILWAQIQTPAPSMSERTGREYPPDLESVIAKSLRKEPTERFQTAREMALALRAAVQGSAVGAPDRTTQERPSALDARTISNAPLGAPHASLPLDSGQSKSATRPIAAEALVIGAASTLPQAIEDPGTARTELVSAMNPAVHDIAGAISRTHGDNQRATAHDPRPIRGRPVLLVAAVLGGLAALVASVALVVLLSRPKREAGPAPAISAQPSTTASSAPVLPKADAPVIASTVAPSVSIIPSVVASTSIAPSAQPLAKVVTAKSKSSHYQAAVEAMNAGDLDAADSEARIAVAQGGGTPALLLLAQVLERRGKKAAARGVYRQVLEKDPTMSAAVAGLKRCGG